MKKNASSILLSVLVLVLLFHFSGCDKLKMSNLQANHHLKKANQYYREEQYRNAIKEYQKALEYNPEMKLAYIYLGTSCSQVYRPGRDDEANKQFALDGIEYLKKAKEYEPDNEKVIVALGDLYDKMGDYDNAKAAYLEILEKKKDDPKSFYTLAQFYSKNGKAEEAEEMYKQRIAMDPKDPDGYDFYVGFLQDQRRWQELIDTHQKRILARMNPETIDVMNEIEQLKLDIKEVENPNQNLDRLEKNKLLDKAQKDQMLAEGREKLAAKPTKAEAEAKIIELQKQKEDGLKRAEAAAMMLGDDEKDAEKKQLIAQIYYSIGNVC